MALLMVPDMVQEWCEGESAKEEMRRRRVG